MKLSLSWLSDFLEFSETDIQKLSALLTEKTAEVDGIIDTAKDFTNVVVGEIGEIFPHPNADRVRVTTVNVGNEVLQIVCGATNIAVGQKVPVAKVGAVLPGNFSIAKRKMRGVESRGMLCSAPELGLDGDEKGIFVFNASAPVGMPLADFLEIGGIVFDIENTSITNRPDLFGHLGFAREFVAIGAGTWKHESLFDFSNIKKSIPQRPLPFSFSVERNEICPARAEVVLENLTVGPSPKWIQKRLLDCGIRPINNIVDTSNFVMLELGVPLHTFDADRIEKNITMRTAKKGEEIVTLDGEKRTLPEGAILQEDNNGIFDLAGIMGGATSEIIATTTRILVHVPVYDPVRIRRAALSMNHRTDAATIYEKRVPNCMVEMGALRTIQVLRESCPHLKIASRIEIVESMPEKKRVIDISKKMIRRVLGTNIESRKIETYFSLLGFEIEKERGGIFSVVVPPFRLGDIAIAEDLTEEIVRLVGLNTIGETAPKMQMRAVSLSPFNRIRRSLADFCVAQNFFEMLSFAFVGPDLLAQCGTAQNEKTIVVKNPLSVDQSLMRQSLYPRLLETARKNRRHRDAFCLFEIGKVFFREENNGVARAQETHRFSALLVGEDFYAARALAEEFFSVANLPFRLRPFEKKCPFLARGVSIFCGKELVGEIFEPPKKTEKCFDLPEKNAGWSLDLDLLATLSAGPKKISALPKFPGSEFDLSVFAPKETIVDDLLRVIKNIDPLLVAATVLEVFSGSGIPEGKKSVTLHFSLRSPERTLSGEEVETIRANILQKLEKKGFPFRF